MRLSIRLGAASLALGWSLALSVPGASAQERGPAAAALEAWVQQIDDLPEVDATYETLTGRGDSAELVGLTIQGSGLLIVFDPINVTNYRELGSNGFAFGRFEVDHVQSRTPTIEINIIDFAVENIAVPETGFVFDETQPLSSILDIWGKASEISIDEISVGRIDIGQFYGGLDSLVSYHNYVIRGWADGHIASSSAGPLVMESPTDDPMIVMTVDYIESRDIDFNAIAWVFDPAAYAGGNRDWRAVLGHAEYDNILVQAPDLQMRIASIAIDDFKMRQAAEPFTPILERLMTDETLTSREADALMQEILIDLISPWGLGGFSIQGLDIYADDIDRFHLGDFHITALSLDGLGEIAVGDLDIVIPDSGSVRLGRLALGGLEMPSEKQLQLIIATVAAGGDPASIASFLPSLSYIELADLEVSSGQSLPVRIDRFLINGGGYLGLAPTDGLIELAGVNVPLTIIGGDLRRILNQMGYTEFNMDFGVAMSWDEASETLHIDNLHLQISDAGSVEASLVIGGVTRAIFENIDNLSETEVAGLTLVSADIAITDESLADRLFAWTAENTAQTAEDYKEQFIRGLPVVLGLTVDRTLAAQVAPPLQAFLRGSSSLVATVRPEAPVPLADVMAALDRSPYSLIGLLGVELTATALE